MIDFNEAKNRAVASGFNIRCCTGFHWQIMGKTMPLVNYWPTSSKFNPARETGYTMKALVGDFEQAIRMAEEIAHLKEEN